MATAPVPTSISTFNVMGNALTKSNAGKALFLLSGHSPSLGGVRAGFQEGMEAETMKECYLLADFISC